MLIVALRKIEPVEVEVFGKRFKIKLLLKDEFPIVVQNTTKYYPFVSGCCAFE